ncbi:MAG: hypothetical protein SFT94_07160 [Pseudanabaenaceae cyanobacterium bins.68]|nr:hypothetical protein [Pseudanabaenaceae cyanobacterium bins.68]
MKSQLQNPATIKSYQEVLKQAPKDLCEIKSEINFRQTLSQLVKDEYQTSWEIR